VPHFDRLKAIGVVLSGSGWEAIQRLSDATAVNGLVNLFVFDPSPVIAFNGPAGNAVTYMTGNIVKAEVGLREHPACFLYLPLRVVIAADDGGEAELRIDHPRRSVLGVRESGAGCGGRRLLLNVRGPSLGPRCPGPERTDESVLTGEKRLASRRNVW
jgi:uncharacterized protein (DUF302 family)